MNRKELFITLILFLLNASAFGQVEDQLKVGNSVEVVIQDGRHYAGIVVAVTADFVELQLSSPPNVKVLVENIASVKLIDALDIVPRRRGGRFWNRDPLGTKNLITPNATNLKKGELFYQNTMLIMNSFGYGITDHLSINVGMDLLTLYSSLKEGEPYEPIYYLSGKASFHADSIIHIALIGSYAHQPIFSSDNGDHWLTLFGVATIGSVNTNLSAGFGVGFVAESKRYSLFTLSATKRLTKHHTILAEAWLYGVAGGRMYKFASLGFRRIQDRWSFDFGITTDGVPFGAIRVGF